MFHNSVRYSRCYLNVVKYLTAEEKKKDREEVEITKFMTDGIILTPIPHDLEDVLQDLSIRYTNDLRILE